MRKLFLFISLFILSGHILYSSKTSPSKEQLIQRTYLSIAEGFLFLKDYEKALFYAESITDQNMSRSFNFSVFKHYLENGDIEKAIESIKQIETIESENKTQTYIIYSQDFREEAIRMIANYYLDQGDEKLAFSFANKYSSKIALSQICSLLSRKYLNKEDYDESIYYAEMIPLEIDKDKMFYEISYNLIYHDYWDRGLSLCQKISTDKKMNEAIRKITNRLIKNGFLERLPELIELLTVEEFQDELKESAVRQYLKQHSFSSALNLAEEIRTDFYKKQAYNQILIGYLNDKLLDKATNFISQNKEMITGQDALRKYAEDCCIAGKFKEALEMAGSMEISLYRDDIYTIILKQYLLINNLDQVNYVIENLITDYPKSAYVHLCRHYCTKNEILKASSFADKLEHDEDKDDIYEVVALHCIEEGLFAQANKFAELIVNTYKKRYILNKVDSKLRFLGQETK